MNTYNQSKWILLEEMTEVTQAIIKAERFGYDNRNPEDPTGKRNIDDIWKELNHLQSALYAYKVEIYDLSLKTL